MHATALARELHIAKVLVPPAPGNFSAWGMLTTDYRQDFTRTRVVRASDQTMPSVLTAFVELEAEAVDFFNREGFIASDVVLVRAADMRHQGQEHTVRVPVPSGALVLAEITDEFRRRHKGAYMFSLTSRSSSLTCT